MKKSSKSSTRAWVLQIAFSIVLIWVLAILLVSSFKGAQVGGEKRFPDERSQEPKISSVQHLAKCTPNLSQPAPQRQLSLADRVAYQYAIEEVYWRHRIWPKENIGPKPSLDEVISPAQVQQKVEDYLLKSQLLADQWQQPVTSKELQAEMDRIARDTKQPEVLQELFAALHGDPALIAECLVRPVLSERLIRDLFAHNR